MTPKEKYIGAFLDGYFSDKLLNYGFTYFNEVENATKLAKKKWKQYKKQKQLWNTKKLLKK
jgi:hypothetical protein